MKKIIVPIDFSESSLNALRVAARIAGRTGAEIHLVNFYEKPVYGFVDLHVDNDKNKKIRVKIKRAMDRIVLQPHMADVEVHEKAISDKALWQVTDVKTLGDADLIVIGKYKSTGLLQVLTGSDVDKLIRHANCPVLCIDENMPTDDININNIVFACDFDAKALKVVSRIVNFANVVDAAVHLMKVVSSASSQDEALLKEQMHDFAVKAGFGEYTVNVVKSGKVEKGILEFASANNADLIAMETTGDEGLTRMMYKSIAESVVHHTERPVLTVSLKAAS